MSEIFRILFARMVRRLKSRDIKLTGHTRCRSKILVKWPCKLNHAGISKTDRDNLGLKKKQQLSSENTEYMITENTVIPSKDRLQDKSMMTHRRIINAGGSKNHS